MKKETIKQLIILILALGFTAFAVYFFTIDLKALFRSIQTYNAREAYPEHLTPRFLKLLRDWSIYTALAFFALILGIFEIYRILRKTTLCNSLKNHISLITKWKQNKSKQRKQKKIEKLQQQLKNMDKTE